MKQKALTKSQYNDLSPFEKGYVCYMQAAWNKDIKDKNPYSENTKEAIKWDEGSFQAMLDCQDSEE